MLENIIEKIKTKEQVKTALTCIIAAFILAIAAQISIPLPGGVPLTLQTFSVALIGFTLTQNKGIKTNFQI